MTKYYIKKKKISTKRKISTISITLTYTFATPAVFTIVKTITALYVVYSTIGIGLKLLISSPLYGQAVGLIIFLGLISIFIPLLGIGISFYFVRNAFKHFRLKISLWKQGLGLL